LNSAEGATPSWLSHSIYITPALIGGAKDQMISSVIAFYATGSANWGMAGALGLILLVITTGLYLLYGRLSADPSVGV
jgi:putative spermidine/putrescine transport system permease protein